MDNITLAPSRLACVSRKHERGAVLVVGLLLLLVLTLAGVVLARMQTVEERMARNEDNHHIALQAAEAALRDAEKQLNNGSGLVFAGTSPGLYTLIPGLPSAADAQIASNWTSVVYSTLNYTGPGLSGVPLAHTAKYVIEELPAVASGSANIGAPGYHNTSSPAEYRTTAYAYGGDGTSTTTIQTIFQTQQ